jgi:hypothetical protein
MLTTHGLLGPTRYRKSHPPRPVFTAARARQTAAPGSACTPRRAAPSRAASAPAPPPSAPATCPRSAPAPGAAPAPAPVRPPRPCAAQRSGRFGAKRCGGAAVGQAVLEPAGHSSKQQHSKPAAAAAAPRHLPNTSGGLILTTFSRGPSQLSSTCGAGVPQQACWPCRGSPAPAPGGGPSGVPAGAVPLAGTLWNRAPEPTCRAAMRSLIHLASRGACARLSGSRTHSMPTWRRGWRGGGGACT